MWPNGVTVDPAAVFMVVAVAAAAAAVVRNARLFIISSFASVLNDARRPSGTAGPFLTGFCGWGVV